MTYVFLDIDGVVNSARSCFLKLGAAVNSDIVNDLILEIYPDTLPYVVTHSLKCIDPMCVALVNRLLKESGAVLVLSSSHRQFLTDDRAPFNSVNHLWRLKKYLESMGFYVPPQFQITPVLHKERGAEIAAFLDNSADLADYVILDDGADFRADQALVKIDPNVGMTFANYVTACSFLAVPSTTIII